MSRPATNPFFVVSAQFVDGTVHDGDGVDGSVDGSAENRASPRESQQWSGDEEDEESEEGEEGEEGEAHAQAEETISIEQQRLIDSQNIVIHEQKTHVDHLLAEEKRIMGEYVTLENNFVVLQQHLAVLEKDNKAQKALSDARGNAKDRHANDQKQTIQNLQDQVQTSQTTIATLTARNAELESDEAILQQSLNEVNALEQKAELQVTQSNERIKNLNEQVLDQTQTLAQQKSKLTATESKLQEASAQVLTAQESAVAAQASKVASETAAALAAQTADTAAQKAATEVHNLQEALKRADEQAQIAAAALEQTGKNGLLLVEEAAKKAADNFAAQIALKEQETAAAKEKAVTASQETAAAKEEIARLQQEVVAETTKAQEALTLEQAKTTELQATIDRQAHETAELKEDQARRDGSYVHELERLKAELLTVEDTKAQHNQKIIEQQKQIELLQGEAAASKLTEDAAASKLEAEAAARKLEEDAAARKLAEDTAASKLAQDVQKIAQDTAAKLIAEDAEAKEDEARRAGMLAQQKKMADEAAAEQRRHLEALKTPAQLAAEEDAKKKRLIKKMRKEFEASVARNKGTTHNDLIVDGGTRTSRGSSGADGIPVDRDTRSRSLDTRRGRKSGAHGIPGHHAEGDPTGITGPEVKGPAAGGTTPAAGTRSKKPSTKGKYVSVHHSVSPSSDDPEVAEWTQVPVRRPPAKRAGAGTLLPVVVPDGLRRRAAVGTGQGEEYSLFV